MGRVRTKLVKRLGNELMKLYADEFTTSFEDNKKKVAELTDVTSKKLRNVIAGYVTHLKKMKS
ncbi:30S ribosomal protein S17e [Candidatus Woesearchaeota archaeon]|nr:30S ribosomal protein S17e [Candidatus Woesearchaeota archaeon]